MAASAADTPPTPPSPHRGGRGKRLAGRGPPARIEDCDGRRFQQAYRDDLDLAKLAQLLPVVGAPVGAVVNWRLVDRLGEAAVMGCRMRWRGEGA